MAEHYSSSTVSISAYCKKCGKYTQHRVDGHRKGPCLVCIDKLNAAHDSAPVKPELARQQNLFVQGVDL